MKMSRKAIRDNRRAQRDRMTKDAFAACINEIEGIKVLREIAEDFGCKITESMSKEDLRNVIIATKEV